jgi:hypothetical protein
MNLLNYIELTNAAEIVALFMKTIFSDLFEYDTNELVVKNPVVVVI